MFRRQFQISTDNLDKFRVQHINCIFNLKNKSTIDLRSTVRLMILVPEDSLEFISVSKEV